jgi:hypothetical protein
MCFDNSNAIVGCYIGCWCFDNSNVIEMLVVGFWVHLNVYTIFQKMWTILSKLKDNCPHFLGSLECNLDVSCYIGCWNMWVATLVVGIC